VSKTISRRRPFEKIILICWNHQFLEHPAPLLRNHSEASWNYLEPYIHKWKLLFENHRQTSWNHVKNTDGSIWKQLASEAGVNLETVAGT
jgi:hypothetical protein